MRKFLVAVLCIFSASQINHANGFVEVSATARLHHSYEKEIKTKLFALSIAKKNASKDDLALSIARTTEIGKVAFDTLMPIVSSVGTILKNATGKNQTFKLDSIDQELWESLWATSSDWNNMSQSNAERVVTALETLGPTYVKFGQALSARPDIIPKRLAIALSTLQDDMEAFDTDIAKTIIENEFRTAGIEEINIAILLDGLSPEPIAAASVGQVYKSFLPNVGEVAIKVQRPGIRETVVKDAALLRSVASFLESIPSPTGKGRFINTEISSAVEEFMSRIFEELDYRNEASNAKKFAALYSNKYGSARMSLPGKGVVVPEIISDYCTENILVMEWINGSKLTSLGEEISEGQDSQEIEKRNMKEKEENLALIEQALYITLSQLLEFGCMHADPHSGNLLKTNAKGNNSKMKSTLAYLDFGLLATIPVNVRDGLVCAVAQLVFAKDVEAVASLFGELDLMPQEIVDDPVERAALTEALRITLEEVLIYPENMDGSDDQTYIPTLKFDKLLDGLVRLVPRFKFQLPPYFINNARALGTLEGTARSLDPDFNAFSFMYPYALNRILQNPSGSPVVTAALDNMVRNTETGEVDVEKIRRLIYDSALYTGFSKRKLVKDILKTRAGQSLAKEALLLELLKGMNRSKSFVGRKTRVLGNMFRL